MHSLAQVPELSQDVRDNIFYIMCIDEKITQLHPGLRIMQVVTPQILTLFVLLPRCTKMEPVLLEWVVD